MLSCHGGVRARAGSHVEPSKLQLTPPRLAALGKSIELLSGRRAPRLIKQKQDFIVAWWRLALARSAQSEALMAATTPPPPSPATRVESQPHQVGVGMGVGAAPAGGGGGGARVQVPPQAASALKGLLGQYGAPDHTDGAAELRVPNERLQIVCSQVAQLVGEEMPRQPRARREWLAQIAMQCQ